MPYVKYTGMRFSNAVVLLGFLPAAVTAGEEPEEDFFQDFMLTKEALKHHFEAAVLMRFDLETKLYALKWEEENTDTEKENPEKNTEHEKGPHFVRQAFLMVLEAHKYLHFCVRSGTTTNQQAQRNERQNTGWKQEQTGMEEELYQEMATVMTHLVQLHLDISELLYFLKVHICGYNEQYDATEATTILRMPPSPNTAATVHLAQWVSHSYQQAKQGGKKVWYTKSMKELLVFLAVRDADPSYVTTPLVQFAQQQPFLTYRKRIDPSFNIVTNLHRRDGNTLVDTPKMKDTVKQYLFYLCMKPEAPLLHHYCRVKGVYPPTCKDGKVFVVDCIIVNNITYYSVEWKYPSSNFKRTIRTTLKANRLVLLSGGVNDDDNNDTDNEDDVNTGSNNKGSHKIGMTFSAAVVGLRLIPPGAGGEVPDDDVLNDFILTKDALEHKFEETAISMHPDNNKHPTARQGFRWVLEANKYLNTCVRFGNNTNQKAHRVDIYGIGMDDELYKEMAHFTDKLHGMDLDINEVLSFMKIWQYGHDDIMKEGKQGWLQKSVQELQLYLAVRDSDPSHFTLLGTYVESGASISALFPNCTLTPDIAVKYYLIDLCMKAYAPLLHHYCRVKGSYPPTCKDGKVFVVDCKIVNNITMYTIEWKGSSLSSSEEGGRASYANIKTNNLVLLDSNDNGDDDKNDSNSNSNSKTPYNRQLLSAKIAATNNEDDDDDDRNPPPLIYSDGNVMGDTNENGNNDDDDDDDAGETLFMKKILSRSKAVQALKDNDNDLVDSIMRLTADKDNDDDDDELPPLISGYNYKSSTDGSGNGKTVPTWISQHDYGETNTDKEISNSERGHDDNDDDEDDSFLPPLISRKESEQVNNSGTTKPVSSNTSTMIGKDENLEHRIGEKVHVHGLVNKTELNGSTGTFMGKETTKDDKLRYKVDLHVDGTTTQLILLFKKDNFRFDDDFNENKKSVKAKTTVATNSTKSSNGKKKKKKKGESSEEKFLRIQNELEAKDPDDYISRVIQEPNCSVVKMKNEVTRSQLAEVKRKETPEGPRMIMATFKCPKNSKPGDVIEVVNPHDLGKKVKVTIPKGTKPKKRGGAHFKVLVPLPLLKKEALPSCCICTITLPKEGEDTYNVRCPLRACVHLCCEICHGAAAGKLCPKCSTPIPNKNTFKLFPFIQHLDKSDSVCEAMLENYFLYKELARDSNDTNIYDALEEAEAKTTKAVDKHYRRASIKVHPDRHGDQFLDEFERLTKARNFMRDETLRRSYLEEMVPLACNPKNLGLIAKSHSLWMEKHDPDKKDQSRPKAPEAGKKEAKLFIEGGMLFSKPKKPTIVNIKKIRNSENHNISILLPILNLIQFRMYTRKLTIYGSCGNRSEEEIVLKQISIHNDPSSKFSYDNGGLTLTVEGMEEGIWDIWWNTVISFDDGKTSIETPKSSEARVDLSSGEQEKMMDRLSGLKVLAHRRALFLRNTMKSPIPTERQHIEERYNELHFLIVKAIDIKKKLQENLKIANEEKTCSTLDEIEIAILAAQAEKKSFENAVGQYEKRDVRKQFRRFIATQLECGEGEDMIRAVSCEELSKAGGDSNRLYQLLIEGKKTSALAFNESVLAAAERRDDLFSKKQRETLRDKIMMVSEASAKELEQIMAEEEKKKKEDTKRKLMEGRVKALGFGRGQRVLLHDLRSRPDLNGNTGFYMGLGESDRYIVQLANTSEEISLKKENFSMWDANQIWDESFNTTTPTPAPAPAPAPAPIDIEYSSNTLKPAPTQTEIKNKQTTTMIPRKMKPNEKCHCGSVRKYKRCCMLSDQNTAALEQLVLAPPPATQPKTASATANAKVSNLRPSKYSSEIKQSSSHDVHEKVCRICLEESRPETLISPCACKGSSRWVHWHCLDEWRTKNKESNTCGECLVAYHVDPHVTVAVMAAIKSSSTAAAAAAATATTTTTKTKANANATTVTNKPEVKKQYVQTHYDSISAGGYTKKRRCQHEKNCHYLRRSPEGCSFYHTKEEILFHHPNYREFVPCENVIKNTTTTTTATATATINEKKKLTHTFTQDSHSYANATTNNENSRSAFFVSLIDKKINNNDSSTTCTKTDTGTIASESSSVNNIYSQELLIDSTSVERVLGKNHKNLVQVMSKTGSKIKIWKKYTNGSIVFKVSGPSSHNVVAAIKLMRDTAAVAVAVANVASPPLKSAPVITNATATAAAATSLPFKSAPASTITASAPVPPPALVPARTHTTSPTAGATTSSILYGNIGDKSNNNNTKNNNSSYQAATMTTEDSTSILSCLTGDGDSLLDNISSPPSIGVGANNGYNVITSVLPPSSSLQYPSLSQQPPPPPPPLSSTIPEGTNGSVTKSAASSSSYFSVQQPQSVVLTPPPPTTMAVADSNNNNNNNNNTTTDIDIVDPALLEFLISKKDCFKVPVLDFHTWLVAEQDIVSMDDLLEACEDDEFVTEEMRKGGLKAFKKKNFIKAVSTYNV